MWKMQILMELAVLKNDTLNVLIPKSTYISKDTTIVEVDNFKEEQIQFFYLTKEEKMMNITIISVGKLKEKYLKQAIDEYSKRLTRYCKIDSII